MKPAVPKGPLPYLASASDAASSDSAVVSVTNGGVCRFEGATISAETPAGLFRLRVSDITVG